MSSLRFRLSMCRMARVLRGSPGDHCGTLVAALRAGSPLLIVVVLGLFLPLEGVFGQALSGNMRRSMGNFRPPSPQTGLQRTEPSQPRSHGSAAGQPGYYPYPGVARWHHHGYYAPHCGWGVYPAVPYWSSYGYIAPLYLPGELLYGPQATARFMGVPQFQLARRREPRYVIVVQPPEKAEPQPEPAAEAPPGKPRVNDRVEAAAQRFLQFGDAHFAAQRFADAYRRYKRAAEVAPRLADAWFRQGFALVALGNFEQAARVWKKGMKIAPEWPLQPLRLDDLYGENPQAKTGHFDAVIGAAIHAPDDADLLFVAGVMLYFDGQKGQARAFFEESLLADPAMAEYVRPFLKAIPEKKAAAEQDAPQP